MLLALAWIYCGHQSNQNAFSISIEICKANDLIWGGLKASVFRISIEIGKSNKKTKNFNTFLTNVLIIQQIFGDCPSNNYKMTKTVTPTYFYFFIYYSPISIDISEK